MTTAKERVFLERSLADLDRELAAGDLSEHDHRRLRADYERRLRGEAPPPRPPARPGLVAATVAFVALVAVGAGVLVAQAVGRRDPGESITGNAASTDVTTPAAPSTTLPDDLARCTGLAASEAIDCFTTYTSSHPDDPNGFIQFGLFSIQAGMQSTESSDELFGAGESFLDRALELDPGNVLARVYLAVLYNRTGRADEAAAACAELADVDVPAEVTSLVDLACGSSN